MVRETEPVRSERRRNVLRLLGAAGGLGVLASVGHAQDDAPDGDGADDDADDDGDDRTDDGAGPVFHVEQGGECGPITARTGEQPVEALYEYTYPRGAFEGPPGVSGRTYSSEGTVDLQREQTSIVFLYEGPDGVSLVFVHGRADEEEAERPAGESDAGGTVSLRVEGLPDDGEWVILDDYYAIDGEQRPSNYDRYAVEDDGYEFHWAYRGGRTDGGVFRGLDDDTEIQIYPAFNDAAGLAANHDYGTIEEWQVLSGDLSDPDRRSLALDRPIRIGAGECPD
jgi:hypothetical protein